MAIVIIKRKILHTFLASSELSLFFIRAERTRSARLLSMWCSPPPPSHSEIAIPWLVSGLWHCEEQKRQNRSRRIFRLDPVLQCLSRNMSQTRYFVHAHLFSLALCFLTINWGNYSSFLLWAGGSSFSPTAILLHYRGWTSHTQILPKLHQVAIIPIPTDPWMGRKQPVSCGSPSYSRRNRCCQLRLYPKFTSYPGYKRSRRAAVVGSSRQDLAWGDHHSQPRWTRSQWQGREQTVLLPGWSPLPGGSVSVLLI